MVLLEGSGYEENRTEYEESELFTVCSYTFIIKDSYGDGICCGYGICYYKLFVDGEQVLSGGQFNTEESKIFNVTEIPSHQPSYEPTNRPTTKSSHVPSLKPSTPQNATIV